MAHLVPNPPPRDYQVPTLTHFTVTSKSGAATVLAWGIPEQATTDQYVVAPLELEAEDDSTECAISSTPHRGLKKFVVKGLRAGSKIAIFFNTGTARQPKWVRFSNAVTIDAMVGDTWADNQASGTLPSYAGNSKIRFYPFGSLQRERPLTERAWMRGVIETLDKIFENSLGKTIVNMISEEVIIYPWVQSYANADSDIHFTAQDWSGNAPGASPDEVLLHEFIHVVEQGAAVYVDGNGFKFEKWDFLTVNATNVYSCLRGRGLRKDHNDHHYLPQEYFTNPKKHFDDFRNNYTLAKSDSPSLYNLLKTSSPLWNPFVF